ncbi:MAG: PD-(D/E)XK nuclease family protein [Xanthobacteraceae bacterium]
MLYGVDIDLKAVCIACQTFALSAIRYFEQSARFPSFFNLNLKLGNTLISPVTTSRRANLANEHSQAIGKMVKLREEAKSLAVNDKAYGRLAELLKTIDEIKLPIVRGLVQDKVTPVLGDSTEDLRPFCWELEFPEVFFESDGTLRASPGFDVVIGNPPWEAIKYHDSEFLGAIGAADLDLEKLVAKIVSASRPSKSVQTVTALARAEPGNGQVQVEVVTPAGLQRPSEKRFGALVHAVLATIDLVATPEMIRQTVSVSARLVDATDQEKEAAVMTVAATLKHPIMMQAAVAARDGEVQRETPIILRRADGTLAEGIVDLAFPENNSGSPRWTVVDFKTGPEFEANRSEYAKQVSLYADAIEKATNLPTRGILLVI